MSKTRELWLTQAARALNKQVFKPLGAALPPKWAVSVGFPKAGGGRDQAIGQCWSPTASQAEVYEMFISPVLGAADPTRVLDVLLHEMVHAAVGLKCGHTGAFTKLARQCGLEGKLTATFVTAGSPLHITLSKLAKRLGPYPHAAMDVKTDPKKGQPWFLVKLRSVNDADYKFTIAPRLIEESGLPLDPWGDEMEVVT